MDARELAEGDAVEYNGRLYTYIGAVDVPGFRGVEIYPIAETGRRIGPLILVAVDRFEKFSEKVENPLDRIKPNVIH